MDNYEWISLLALPAAIAIAAMIWGGVMLIGMAVDARQGNRARRADETATSWMEVVVERLDALIEYQREAAEQRVTLMAAVASPEPAPAEQVVAAAPHLFTARRGGPANATRWS